MGKYYIPFIVAFVITYLTTPFAKKIAYKVGAIDVPKDERRIHKKPIPRMGGLAIYIATMIAIIIFLPMNKQTISIMIGGSIIALSGMVDDVKELPPKAKLALQIIAAAVIVAGGIRIDFLSNPFAENGMLFLGIFSIPATMFWIVGITNTLNLIDGLDGLASGVASIAATTLLFVSAINGFPSVMILAAIIAGSSLGFLPHNFNPAKIFMGDTGSLFLGYMLSIIAIQGVMKSVATIALAVPILALGFPIFDTTFAIVRRFINGKPIMQADKGHLHHRLLDRGLTQIQTVLVLYAISASLGILAVLLSDVDTNKGIMILGIATVTIVLGASRLGLFHIKSDESK